jgi:hydroxyacylglutathione hydrolase
VPKLSGIVFFRQIYDEGLAHASYVIGDESTGEALVVDPRRDIDVYTDLAVHHDLRIVAVAETHIHADYLSGGGELAAAVGAPLYVSGHGDAQLGYLAEQEGVRVQLVRNGDVIHIGNVRARVRHTPGHTPEHLCFEIFDDKTKPQPMMLLSGDFMFVGDLGRPDLLEEALGAVGTARASAHVMFSSLKSTLADLPDFIQIWPAHGAGSACGKALGAVPSTTLGYERRFSWWSAYAESGNEGGFVDALLEGQPDAPTYFARMKRLNRGYSRLLGRLPDPPRLTPAVLKAAVASGATLIDTRPRGEFSTLHIEGSISIPDQPSFSARAAWFASPDHPIVLLARPERIELLVRRLVRVGLDNVSGYIADVKSAGLPTASLPGVGLDEAQKRWSSDQAVLLDVRQLGEFAEAHVPGATHISSGRLRSKIADVPKNIPLLVMCARGDRSVSAASVLSSLGFKNVATVPEGFDEWRAQGLPIESGNGSTPHRSAQKSP